MSSKSETATNGTVEKDYSRAEFEALLDAAVDAIIVTDSRGRIRRFNRAAETLFGYSANEAVGQSIELIMNERDSRAHDSYMRNYMNTGERKIIGIGREVMARQRDGQTFPVALSIGEANVGDEQRFVGLVRDLREQRRTEEEALQHREQLAHVGRLTTVGEMAAAMAHEMNQPLSAIANYTAACLRLLDQGEEGIADVRKALREIVSQAHRAGEVIQRIRAFVRGRSVARQPVDVRNMIGEILPLAAMDAKANHTDLRIRIDKDLPTIMVDRVEIQQVILNLLRNGVDAMQELPERERRIDLRAWLEDAAHIRIAITDRGHGVDAEAAANLFTPFFTTKDSGMGLGLAISRSIISAHGGMLDFRNNPLCGATFDITLPTSVEE
jgi:two-component system sensor kinase FixL